MRNEQMMRIWFAAWNGDIQRSRDEYDRREAGIARFHVLLKEGRIPDRCKSRKHALTEETVAWSKGGRWRCTECRNDWQNRNWRRVHPQRRKVGPKKKLSWTKQREVAALYRDGMLTRDLVIRFGVAKPTILRAVRNAGVTVRGRQESARIAQPKGESPHLTPNQRLKIVARYNQNESSSDLSAAFGVSSMTILRTIRNAGVPARTRSESMKISHAQRKHTTTGRTP